MEDRYEIRGKIGQGGLGAVYRGYDIRMNREVAVKRISTSPGDPSLQEESTRQLLKEAGALASLQHPNIVTVYDVGSDEDGPYVVMELISGKTIEELIEQAPLTWADFREVALQTQEALIAAQEHNLVHGDIKPSNLMLAWLPSGKFQIKIVDFGLATLIQSQSSEELQALDSVFGSVFFMSPEQFERQPLDARSDLYSMGCVYYQALTGVYPFIGASCQEVMEAHLKHTVRPIQELRSGIPLWACEWIMGLISRRPADRPETAREALSLFLQSDKNASASTTSTGAAADPNTQKRPRLVIPGTAPAPAEPSAPPEPPVAPQPQVSAPLMIKRAKPASSEIAAAPEIAPAPEIAAAPVPPVAVVPVLEVASAPAPQAPAPVLLKRAKPATEVAAAPAPEVAPAPVPEVVAPPVPEKSAPQPLMPPEGSKPSVHATVQSSPVVEPEPVVASPTAGPPKTSLLAGKPVQPPTKTSLLASGAVQAPPKTSALAAKTGPLSASPTQIGGQTPSVPMKPAVRRGLSNTAKTTIAAILGLLVVLLGWFLIDRSGKNRDAALYNEVIALAAKDDTTEIPFTAYKLELVLNAATHTGILEARETVYRALALAKATDGTDIDARIVEFATTRKMLPEVREVLIGEVLRRRKNPAVVPKLLDYSARGDADPRAAAAALMAIRFMADDGQFNVLLKVLERTTKPDVRKSAEEALVQILKKSTKRAQHADTLAGVYESSLNDDVRHAALRLLGRCSESKAIEIIKRALTADVQKDQIAAIIAIGNWADDTVFPVMTDFLATQSNPQLRSRAFDSAIRLLNDVNIKRKPEELSKLWLSLSAQAKIGSEKLKIIYGVVNITEDWVIKLLKSYAEDDDDQVADLAERAISRVEEAQKLRGEKK